ncbi:MAG: hypothetical protein QOE60_2614 [Thermoleophilaceae bacterium]|jgi:hypothetical protein|nr:hypothetical protein [Thermoleophilaceae bacterium]
MNEPEPQPQLPEVADVMVSTAASLVNLAGIRLTQEDQLDPAQAKEAIEAARALLPLLPEEAVAPVKDALAQVQMLYVKETQGTPAPEAAPEPPSKIWTPPGS